MSTGDRSTPPPRSSEPEATTQTDVKPTASKVWSQEPDVTSGAYHREAVRQWYDTLSPEQREGVTKVSTAWSSGSGFARGPIAVRREEPTTSFVEKQKERQEQKQENAGQPPRSTTPPR